MRIRTIKPEVCASLTVAGLPNDSCRLHWEHLWLYADDDGRGIDDARLLKAALWPLDDKKTGRVVDSYQEALAAAKLIIRYYVDGRRYFQIVNWTEHQRIDRPKDSAYPPPELADGHEPPPTPPRGFDEQSSSEQRQRDEPSLLEGKGTGNREQGSGTGNVLAAADGGCVFDDFWHAYPRHVAKPAALKAWKAATKHVDPNLILVGAERLAADPNLPPDQFIPHPATWLNQHRWNDGPYPPAVRGIRVGDQDAAKLALYRELGA